MSIKLRNVPVVTPNCDIVVPNLTLDIEPGMHLLITGPSKIFSFVSSIDSFHSQLQMDVEKVVYLEF